MNRRTSMTQYEAAIRQWAIDHFGPDCAPSLHEDAAGLVLSISRIEHGTRHSYRLPLEPLGNGLFRIQGVTVDVNAVH
jgi:hypothetical protein